MPRTEASWRRADAESSAVVLGAASETAGSPQTATYRRRSTSPLEGNPQGRVAKGFGLRRSDWHRGSASTYTWLRTMKSWLHKIGNPTPPIPAGTCQMKAHMSLSHAPGSRGREDRWWGSRPTGRTWTHGGGSRRLDDEPYGQVEAFPGYLFHTSWNEQGKARGPRRAWRRRSVFQERAGRGVAVAGNVFDFITIMYICAGRTD